MIPSTSASILKKGYSILFMLLPFLAMAQESFNDNTNDTQQPQSPIDNYLLLALLLGVYFAYRFLQNKIKQITN